MTDYRPAAFGHLPWLLKLAEREVGKELDRELRHTGITKSQFGVLQALVHLRRASSAALARTVFVTPQAMVNIVSELERKGFIKRKASPASARVIEAAVTPAGRAAFEKGSKAIRNVDDLLAAEFSERELERFVQYLERCVRARVTPGARRRSRSHPSPDAPTSTLLPSRNTAKHLFELNTHVST